MEAKTRAVKQQTVRTQQEILKERALKIPGLGFPGAGGLTKAIHVQPRSVAGKEAAASAGVGIERYMQILTKLNQSGLDAANEQIEFMRLIAESSAGTEQHTKEQVANGKAGTGKTTRREGTQHAGLLGTSAAGAATVVR